jgi:uncharacterized protein YbjT (DUF2867 family)
VARVLIVGCGCRGRALARELVSAGHAVRGSTRTAAKAEQVAAAGAEPYVGDPDRVGTLIAALEGTAIVCWLLGSAAGDESALAQLHGARLRAFCEKLVDTGVRGFVYEAAGTVAPDVLAGGARIAEEAGATWMIPVQVLDTDPRPVERWLRAAHAGVDALLARG